MDWWHESSPGWMLARRDVITASEIRSCLSAYNRATEDQKAGRVLLPAFAALWLEKQAEKAPDTWSQGAAARGHIAEPFAVADYNSNHEAREWDLPPMYHWDDVIIKSGGCGWSPDGCTIPMESYEPELLVSGGKLVTKAGREWQASLPTGFIEIKSYEPERHMKCMLTPKEKLDERWQMAVAFHVVPALETGVILFYSVNTDYSFEVVFERGDLKAEIDQVGKMVDLWNTNVANLEQMPIRFDRIWSEQDIHDQWIETSSTVLLL